MRVREIAYEGARLILFGILGVLMFFFISLVAGCGSPTVSGPSETPKTTASTPALTVGPPVFITPPQTNPAWRVSCESRAGGPVSEGEPHA